MWALLILVCLAVPALGIAGFFIALGARERLARMEWRLSAIEGRLAALSATMDQQVRETPSPVPSAPQPEVARGPASSPTQQPRAESMVAAGQAPQPEFAAAHTHETTTPVASPN